MLLPPPAELGELLYDIPYWYSSQFVGFFAGRLIIARLPGQHARGIVVAVDVK
jgi:hypothetical protein